jgi:hypothetical protein
MTSEVTHHQPRPPATPLIRAALGAFVVLMIVLLPSQEPWYLAWGAALLGGWLCVASLLSYFTPRLPNRHGSPEPDGPKRPTIPLRFSGSTGRFVLRVRGDGRRVEVRAGPEIVAEVIAADSGDEIVVYPDEVPDDDLEHLGSAIAPAI